MAMQAVGSDHEGEVQAIVLKHKELEGPLLPILHDIQNQFGHVSDEAVRVIAEGLNLTRAEVFGVKSFYHDFTEHRLGRHIIKVCRAEACQANGGRVVAEQVQEALGLDWHETSADGAVSLVPVYCLGLCSCGPAVMVDGQVRGRMGADQVSQLVEEVRS